MGLDPRRGLQNVPETWVTLCTEGTLKPFPDSSLQFETFKIVIGGRVNMLVHDTRQWDQKNVSTMSMTR